jgi:hypothetical protein
LLLRWESMNSRSSAIWERRWPAAVVVVALVREAGEGI